MTETKTEGEGVTKMHPVVEAVQVAWDAMSAEYEILEKRVLAALELPEDAPKVDVKNAIARLKRAALDTRDAMKQMGKITAE